MRNRRRDNEYTEFVAARLQALRRIAYLLCQDWHHADDLVQLTITRLYVHWHRVGVMDNPEAYTRTILVRQFLRERGSGWARKVSLPGEMPDWPDVSQDHDDAIDVPDAGRNRSPDRARLAVRPGWLGRCPVVRPETSPLHEDCRWCSLPVEPATGVPVQAGGHPG